VVGWISWPTSTLSPDSFLVITQGPVGGKGKADFGPDDVIHPGSCPKNYAFR
jgi:hypothetical protein